MNLPNKLTVLRICLVPFSSFLLADFVPHRYLFALLLFCAASYTDHLDGRSPGEITSSPISGNSWIPWRTKSWSWQR